MREKMSSPIEILEDRIAPATLINPMTVTYTDKDGDAVLIKSSKAIFLNANVANAILNFDSGAGAVNGSNQVPEQLRTIDLTGSSFDAASGAQIRALASNTNLTVKVLPRVGVGNGSVDVGYIKAAVIDSDNLAFVNNIDLGTITIGGDLGRIDVGDSVTDPAIKALNVGSIGKTTTQDPLDSGVQSNFFGPVGSIHVAGDVNAARLHVLGAQFGNLGKLVIGGALRGGATGNSGQVAFTGKLGSAVLGDLIGGAGQQSGTVIGSLNNSSRPSSIAKIRVLGSVTGGGGTDSGEIAAFNLGAVQIDHDLVGDATGKESGFVFAKNALGSMKIGGSVRGAGGETSGGILSNGAIGLLSVGGDVLGGAGLTSGKISAAMIKTAQIGGSLKGGGADETGQLSASATLGRVTILGDVVGGAGKFGGNVFAGTSIASLKISGGVSGGLGDSSGRVFTAKLSALEVGLNVQGGVGDDSGEVLALNLVKGAIGVDLKGGAGDASGSVIAGLIGNLTVHRSVVGGAGDHTGFIAADLATVFGKTSQFVTAVGIGTLAVTNDVQGGAGNHSGEILTSGTLASAKIGGALLGGNVNKATDVTQSGYIEARHITKLTVGAMVGGSNSGAGGISSSGSIRATQDIDTLNVVTNILGTAEDNVIISAVGFPSQAASATTDLAIKTITVGGSVTRTEILAGYDTAASGTNHRGVLTNGDAQIGAVHLGSIAASSIVAGVNAGANKFFGDATDTAGPDKIAAIVSKIASVIVDGTAAGSTNGNENFGMVAQFVQSVKVNGTALKLNPAASDDPAPGVAIDPNFAVVEV